MLNSGSTVAGFTMDAHMVICSVKKLSQRKKPHLNRLTLSDAKAAHVLKKLIQAKIHQGGGLFEAAQNCVCYKNW